MDGSNSGVVPRRFLLTLALAFSCGAASAATIPGYTVTDLGAGEARLSADSGGRGIVLASDGTTYDFPVSDQALPTSQAQAIIATLPKMTNAPVWSPMTYGNPNFAFSYLAPSNVFLNDQGVLVVTNAFGVDGHSSGAGSTLLTAQRQPDGSFGPLTSLWGSNGNGQFMTGPPATAIALNKLGQVLGTSSMGYTTSYLLHDPVTGQTTNLRDLLPSGWSFSRAIALDDLGRILVTAYPISGYQAGPEHPLLLSPDAVPVPEPSALATIALGVSGLAFRRYRGRNAGR
jgi:hypothetical protein